MKAHWREAPVDPTEEHFAILYDDTPVARLGRASEAGTFFVEFVPTPSISALDRDAVRRQLDFYLVEKDEPDPWAYAAYHAKSAANIYSRVHWVHVEPTGTRSGDRSKPR